MSLPADTIGSLFSMSREPVLGVGEGRTIVFANPAASALLGVKAGDDAADLLPEDVLSNPAEHFISTFRLGDKRARLSVHRLEGVAVCSCSLNRTDPPLPADSRALEELSSHLMSARLAVDALVRGTKAEDDTALSATVQTLYHEYYQLLRTCRHMKLASSILSDSLPLMPGVTDLGTLCRELCDTAGRLFESMGVSVTFEADFALHLTMADSDLLECMLSNLLCNSLAHCHSGDAVHVELTRRDDRFIIGVRDTGDGIPPEKMRHIFDGSAIPAEADLTAGAGQGLLIARGIAERHGGSVMLESQPGKGTHVIVSIPYRQTDSLQMNTPRARYRSDGMNTVLTEFSVILDKKYYTRRMFD